MTINSTADIKRIGTNPLMEPRIFSDKMYPICPEGTLKLLEQISSHQIVEKDKSLSYISKIYKDKMPEFIKSNDPTKNFRIAVESENSVLLKRLLNERPNEIDFEKIFNDLTNPWSIQFMIDQAIKLPLETVLIKFLKSWDPEVIKAILTAPRIKKLFAQMNFLNFRKRHLLVIEQNLELFSFDQVDTYFLKTAIAYKCCGIVKKIMDSKAVIKVDIDYFEYKIKTDSLAYFATKCLESDQQDLANHIQTVIKNRNMLCNKIYNTAATNLYAMAGICLAGVVIIGKTEGLLPGYAANILAIASMILFERNHSSFL